MKFNIKDRNGNLPELEDKTFEFENLEEFAKWAVQVELPRHTFVPPRASCLEHSSYSISNSTDNWLIYCESDYD